MSPFEDFPRYVLANMYVRTFEIFFTQLLISHMYYMLYIPFVMQQYYLEILCIHTHTPIHLYAKNLEYESILVPIFGCIVYYCMDKSKFI